jgi:hypothetical protein
MDSAEDINNFQFVYCKRTKKRRGMRKNLLRK